MKKKKKEFAVMVFAVTFILCGVISSYAAQNGSVNENVLTFTYESDNTNAATRFNLYLLANGAQILTEGKSAGNVQPRSTGSGSGYDNITEPIPKGTKSSGLWITDSGGNKIKAASKVEYGYQYRRGRLTVTVKLYDPAPELSGIAIVGITSNESANYYSDAGGTLDISGYIREMYKTGTSDSGEEESTASNEEGRKPAPEINIGTDSGKHRPPCILRRLGQLFSS